MDSPDRGLLESFGPRSRDDPRSLGLILDLGGEPAQPAGIEHRQKNLHKLRIQLSPAQVSDLRDGILKRPRPFVGPFVRERVKNVGNRDNPALNRDAFSRQTQRVSRSIPALVMRKSDLARQLQDRQVAAAQNLSADGGVRLHDLELFRSVAPVLQQNLIRYSDFAEVVESSRQAQPLRST